MTADAFRPLPEWRPLILPSNLKVARKQEAKAPVNFMAYPRLQNVTLAKRLARRRYLQRSPSLKTWIPETEKRRNKMRKFFKVDFDAGVTLQEPVGKAAHGVYHTV